MAGEFSVFCYFCGAETEPADSPSEAVAAALTEGWRPSGRGTPSLCPACKARLECGEITEEEIRQVGVTRLSRIERQPGRQALGFQRGRP